MVEHKTKNVVIKSAPVDVEMIPVVNWLNSFGSVTTRYCCQGNKSLSKIPYGRDVPYVMFTCRDLLDLSIILQKSHCYAKVEVTYIDGGGTLQYIMNFTSVEIFHEFVETLTEKRLD